MIRRNRLAINVSDATRIQIDKFKREHGVPINELVNRAISFYLEYLAKGGGKDE